MKFPCNRFLGSILALAFLYEHEIRYFETAKKNQKNILYLSSSNEFIKLIFSIRKTYVSIFLNAIHSMMFKMFWVRFNLEQQIKKIFSAMNNTISIKIFVFCKSKQ